MSFWLLFSALLAGAWAECATDEPMVNFSVPLGGLFPMRRSPAGLHREAVFRAAIDILNEDATGCREVMTSGVQLEPLVESTSSLTSNSDSATGLDAAFDLVRLSHVAGIVGPASSAVSEIVQLVAKLHEVPQVSYSATSPTLSAKSEYPYFYRTCPPDNFQGKGIANIVNLLGWEEVAAISSSSTYGSSGIDAVITALTDEGVQVAVSKQITADMTADGELSDDEYAAVQLALEAIADTKVHVIVCFANKADIVAVLQVATDLGLTGEGYVWFLPDYGPQITGDELDFAGAEFDGMLGMLPLRGSGDVYDDFLSSWRSTYNQRGYVQTGKDGTVQYNDSGPWSFADADAASNPLNYDSFNSTDLNSYAPYSFDATWAFGLAINQAVLDGVEVDLDADSSLFLAAVNEHLAASNFTGLTGAVSFDENLDREGGYQVLQFQGGEWVDVGTWSPQEGLAWVDSGDGLVWNSGQSGVANVPPSILPIKYEFRGVSDGAKAAGYAFLAVGTAVAFGFFVFQHQRRNHKYMKLGTPPLNNMMLMGCVMVYTAVLLAGVETPDVCASGERECTADDGVCHARLWLFALSASVVFGPLLSKTYRVNKVFNNKKLKQVRITANMLIRYVAMLVSADVLVLLVFSASDNPQMVTNYLPLEVNPDQEDQFLQPWTVECTSDNMGAYVAFFMVEKGLLVLAGAVLAYETRNVQIPACNDSSSIGVAIHTLLVISVVVVPVLFMVNDDPNTEYIVLAVSGFMAATVVQCVIFAPKVMAFINNTAELDAEIRTDNTTTGAGTSSAAGGGGGSSGGRSAPAPAPTPAAPAPAYEAKATPSPVPGRETHNPAFSSVRDSAL